MIYLKKFKLLNDYEEHLAFQIENRTIFKDVYPFHIFPFKELETITFDHITCFYGGNGSGKTTLLNIIASKLNATRLNSISKGELFNLYVKMCKFDFNYENAYNEVKVISSDDVFDYLLDIRSINMGVNRYKNELCQEYLSNKYSDENDNINDYYAIKQKALARSKSMSKYVKHRLTNNTITEHSNGESALLFWEKEIGEHSLYILDEPENSLSAENQIKLKTFIEEAVRFYNCQFIISTHSPFLLSLKEAKIYDLDSNSCQTKKWSELKNVRIYYDFFKEHDKEFKEN